jgi:hypothetical protein
LDSRNEVKFEIRSKAEEISAMTRAHIFVLNPLSPIGHHLNNRAEPYNRNVSILMTGSYESVEQARIRYLVLLDELVYCPSFDLLSNAD